jgi:hypothetical protein
MIMPAFAQAATQMFAFVIMVTIRVIVRMNMSILQRYGRGIHRLE